MFGDFEDDDRLWTPRQFLTNVGGALALWAVIIGSVWMFFCV